MERHRDREPVRERRDVMSVSWAGRNEWSPSSLRRWLTPAARRHRGIRLHGATDRAVLLFTNRRRPVQFSEWRRVLETLQQLPTIAAGGIRSSLSVVPVENPPGRVDVGAVSDDTPTSRSPSDAAPIHPMMRGGRLWV